MFSIENFNRPEKEVSAVMDLARQKLSEITQHGYELFCISFGILKDNSTSLCAVM